MNKLKKSGRLKGTKIYINDDYSKDVQEERKNYKIT